MKKLILPVLSLLFVVSACTNSVKNDDTSKGPVKLSSTFDAGASVLTQQKNEMDPDSIRYDTIVFPDDTVFIGKILFPGVFHEGEVWDEAGSEKWLGLVTDGKSFNLTPCDIKTARVIDPIMDEDTLRNGTGCEVTVDHKDTVLYLLSGMDFLKPRPVNAFRLPKREIFPGDTLTFTFHGKKYSLYASGGKLKTSDEPLWYEVWNYKLYMSISSGGKEQTELLVAQPQFDDTMTRIEFIGDLDGDGILDLIIDTSPHYNVSTSTLYLSKPATKSRLYKVAAQYIITGC